MAAGRPTDYNQKFASIAKRFALLGLTNDEMADALDIARSTFYEWLKAYPEFSDAIQSGKDSADAKVAQSLYHRAKGYKTTETDVKVIDGKIVLTELQKNYPPDPASMIFWLRNRQPKLWRNKPDSTEEDQEKTLTINIVNPNGQNGNDQSN